jgi:uncharacterized protein
LSEGDGVLYDPLALTVEDTAALDEQRWQTLGMFAFGKLMIVVWTQRDRDMRLISVRKAGPKERRDYEKGN